MKPRKLLIKSTLKVAGIITLFYCTTLLLMNFEISNFGEHKGTTALKTLDQTFLSCRLFTELRQRHLQSFDDVEYARFRVVTKEQVRGSAYSITAGADMELDHNKFWWIWPNDNKQHTWLAKAQQFNIILQQIASILRRDDTGYFAVARTAYQAMLSGNMTRDLQQFQSIATSVWNKRASLRLVFLTDTQAFARLARDRDVVSLYLGWQLIGQEAKQVRAYSAASSAAIEQHPTLFSERAMRFDGLLVVHQYSLAVMPDTQSVLPFGFVFV